MIKRILLAAMICMICLFTLSGTAIAVDNGEISGKVVNGTTGESGVAGIEVSLWKGTMAMDTVSWEISGTADTDQDGNFTFDGLSTSDDQDVPYLFHVSTEYEDVEYGTTSSITLSQEEPSEEDVEITVYDTTTSDADIKLHALQVYITMSPDQTEDGRMSLEIVEYYYFNNKANPKTTFVGGIQFSLPEGIGMQDVLMYDNGIGSSNNVETSDGFADNTPVRPGKSDMSGMMQVYMAYRIDTTLDSYVFGRTVHYIADAMNIFTQEEVEGRDIQVSSSQLLEGGTEIIDETAFRSWETTNVADGKLVEITFSGLHESSDGNSFLWVVVPIVAAVAVAAIAGFVLIKRRSKSDVELQPMPIEGRSETKEQLLRELADLDDQFESGGIPQEEYDRLRAEKKMRLSQLMDG